MNATNASDASDGVAIRPEKAMRLTLLRSVSATFVGLVSASILGRGLGVIAYGRYQLIVNLAAQIGQVCEAGVGTAVISIPQRENGRASDVIRLTMRYFLWLILPTLALTIGLMYLLVREASQLLIVCGCIISLATLLQFLMVGILRASGRPQAANALLIIPALVNLPIIIGLWWSGLLSTFTAILSLTIANLLMTVLGVFGVASLAKETGESDVENLARRLTNRDLLTVSWRSSLARISQLLIYRFDLFLLAFFVGEESIGHYVPAVFLVSQLNQIGDSVGFILYPSVARQEMNSSHVGSACRGVMLVTVLASTAMAILCPWIFRLIWGSAFNASVIPLLLLLPGYILLTPARVLSAYLAASTAFQSPLRASLTGLAVNSLLNLCLIPTFGIIGAAIATSIALACISIMLSLDFIRETGMHWHQLWLPQIGDIQRLFRSVRSRQSHFE
jgi:O-antigen/teichoic acid export membrane protein